MRSLRLKLSLLFMLVSLVAVLIVALWFNEVSEREFCLYCEHTCMMEGDNGEGDGQDCFSATMSGAREQAYLDALQHSLWQAALIAAMVAILLAFFFSRLITGPINSLKWSAQRIRDGDFAQRVKVQTEDELGELALTFNSMAEQLELRERGRKQLLADVAHELRTPLSIIQGNLEAWRDGVVAPTAESIAPVHEEAVTLARLITDLRDLSLAEAGQLSLHREPTNMQELVSSVLGSYSERAGTHGVALNFAPEAQLPPVDVDPGRVRQVLSNLLDNALRHTPRDGSIRVSLSAGPPEFLTISVEDDGAGIAAEDLPHVFEHFYKVDRSRERSRSGSGIGLAIVKQIVEAHGGQVRVVSTPGKGSSFSFTLPASHTESA
ncbi:MAG: HAMP domain-containing histidine kinase [Dehalococcoidia bacterium]|nr:HAMP domain-containing histidine kinase [Dehalococcoidia bacterium]